MDRTWRAEDVAIDHGQCGEGYGASTPASQEAIHLLARTEGILTDPRYSGKALAGLVEHGRNRKLRGPVIFWHMGGTPALFEPNLGARPIE